MANRRTLTLTQEQYDKIIRTLLRGFSSCRANRRIATALMLEANLGMRIGDVLHLRLKDIVKDGDHYRLDTIEEKTKKKRTFTVNDQIYRFIKEYCYDCEIPEDAYIFALKGKDKPITERMVQKQLKLVCDYLEIDGVSTHSFRKFFATSIYNENGHNVVLVQKLLQHSSPSVTQRYLGVSEQEIEQALDKHTRLIS